MLNTSNVTLHVAEIFWLDLDSNRMVSQGIQPVVYYPSPKKVREGIAAAKPA